MSGLLLQRRIGNPRDMLSSDSAQTASVVCQSKLSRSPAIAELWAKGTRPKGLLLHCDFHYVWIEDGEQEASSALRTSQDRAHVGRHRLKSVMAFIGSPHRRNNLGIRTLSKIGRFSAHQSCSTTPRAVGISGTGFQPSGK